MERLNYKGYTGSIEYSKEDNCLFGEVLGLRKEACITYEGNTAAELYDDFKAGIDHYIACCKAEGKEPQKPYSGTLNIRIPSEIHRKIAMLAKDKQVSINTIVRDSLEHHLLVAY
ncbi:MAG: type II toxin-antitoxin system HicB family antitoxin [Tannerella sp.]|jgi:predicted HicB family RNase H-like nuclease|nr:type II toxin-antitoxin system HicB family antitoxin [Tannerella sp.]